MNFHYDFVLKVANQTAQSQGAVPLRSLIENSYWWILQDHDVKCLQKQISELEACISEKRSILRDEEVEAYRVKCDLEEKVGNSQNSKKKAAIRELEMWKADHRESTWAPILARVSAWQSSCKELDILRESLASALHEINVPSIRRRLLVLEEYGYVDAEGGLCPKGRLASEINEGHPFLSTELFLRLQEKSSSWDLPQLLTILAVFLGELGDSDDMSKNKHPNDLDVSVTVRDELLRIGDDAKLGCKRESRACLVADVEYWSLSTEWVEPISAWVSGSDILPVIAAQFEIFEGNLQKALMKLMGLVDEFRALATLAGDLGWLEVLEGAQAIVLRDVVVAESLYLRL
jgi:superfamily II RNA helicase